MTLHHAGFSHPTSSAGTVRIEIGNETNVVVVPVGKILSFTGYDNWPEFESVKREATPELENIYLAV
jgi:hypothetical protein